MKFTSEFDSRYRKEKLKPSVQRLFNQWVRDNDIVEPRYSEARIDLSIPAHRQAQEAKNSQRSLYLEGSIGPGKTYIANALIIQDYWKSATFHVCRRHSGRLPDSECICAITNAWRHHGGKVSQVIQSLYRDGGSQIKDYLPSRSSDYEILLLDELGIQNSTAWITEQLYTIIDAWYSSSKMMIVTSNMSRAALKANLNEATVSRLSGLESIEYEGEDRRPGESK